ncbi:RidA family protein [Micromonospora rifamycinica]|uniref:RidA family protein n=1 Tax=Micromonospora rifamycinica TaxID=291594 RepID=UPI003405B29C
MSYHEEGNPMGVQFFSPQGMTQPVPYHHVAVGSGSRHVHVAGQISRDEAGRPVAGADLRGQVAQALRNTGHGLGGAGASFADVVRLTFYVTNWSPERIGDFMAGVEDVAGELGLPQPLPPSSLIGVDYLFEPDVLVEVEATAILD